MLDFERISVPAVSASPVRLTLELTGDEELYGLLQGPTPMQHVEDLLDDRRVQVEVP